MTTIAAALIGILAVLPMPSPTEGLAPPLEGVQGTASWYGTSGPGIYAAAGPALRVGDWRGRTVTVCADSCVTLKLTDWCACPQRVIDLSKDAFRRLAPLSQGLVHVTVSWGGPEPTVPPTDTGPGPTGGRGRVFLL